MYRTKEDQKKGLTLFFFYIVSYTQTPIRPGAKSLIQAQHIALVHAAVHKVL